MLIASAASPRILINVPPEIPVTTTTTPGSPALSSALAALNLPEQNDLAAFCASCCSNILEFCPASGAKVMSEHLQALLSRADDVEGAGNKNVRLVTSLTHNLLADISQDHLDKAQDAARKINNLFNSDVNNEGLTKLDVAFNKLELPYHNATHPNGRMGHAKEMASDMAHFFDGHEFQELASLLGYFHDHVQLLDSKGMGIGNTDHWGLNEIATAAALATLADAAQVDAAGQEALLMVSGAAIPAGTAYSYFANALGDGKGILGTLIEVILLRSEWPEGLGSGAEDVIAMGFTLATCDTGRSTLKGLVRTTDDNIRHDAPTVYEVLEQCAKSDVGGFGKVFFESGKLTEAGLALCGKLTSTITVFEEFDSTTTSTAPREDKRPNNPLSKHFNPDRLTPSEARAEIFKIISNNGSFGSDNIATKINSFSDSFSHAVLKKVADDSLLPDPRSTFSTAYKTFAAQLDQYCENDATKLQTVLNEMKAMGGSEPIHSS